MGSDKSTKRRKKDKPILRLPQSPNLVQSVSGTGTGGTFSAEVCVLSFDVKVRDLAFVKEKTPVYLHLQDDRYAVKIMDHEIGLLSRSRSAMVKQCKALGINYKGEILIIKDEKYARFFRTTTR